MVSGPHGHLGGERLAGSLADQNYSRRAGSSIRLITFGSIAPAYSAIAGWYATVKSALRWGKLMSDPPIEVNGISLLVRLVPDEAAAIQLQCPRGASILYGEIVSRGDGLDSGGNVFRAMPHIGAIVAFEESSDETRGHSFVVASDELRLVTLDDILVALPPRWWRRKTRS